MGYNTILGRYLSLNFLKSFIMILAIVAGIVFLFDMIEIVRRYGDNELADGLTLLKLGLSRLPQTFNMIFPFVMLIAAQVSFYKLSKTNEYVVIRTAGADLWQFLKPVLYTTFIIGLFNIMLLNPMLSKMYELHEIISYRLDVKNPNAFVFSDKGLWIKEGENGKSVILNAKNIRQETENELLLRNVLILELKDNKTLSKRIEAFAGVLSEGFIDLKDVKIYKTGQPIQKLGNLEYKTTLDITRVKESFIDPDAISFWQLPPMISFYQKAGFSASTYLIKFLSLLALPFLLCSLVLLAAIFSLQTTHRKGTVMYLVVSGLSTGFLIYFLSQLIYAFGASNIFPPALAAFSPAVIVGLISTTVLLQMEEK
ncbi:MAG: LptF/LptG family permease [Alphaproteobacteria bacterium]